MLIALESGKLADAGTSQPTSHPLATRAGMAVFAQLVEAGSYWDAATKRQRELLVKWCTPTLSAAAAGELVDPPALPGRVPARTVESLRAKGLADGARLTQWAVMAAAHGPSLRGTRPPREVTVQTVGGVL